MLYTLCLNGALDRAKGLIIGQFTDWKANLEYSTMYDMVADMVRDYKIPVAYGFPIGHVDRNLPMIEGAEVELEVTKTSARLKFL